MAANIKADPFEIPANLKRSPAAQVLAAPEKKKGKVIVMPPKADKKVKPSRKQATQIIKRTDKPCKARPGSKRAVLLAALIKCDGKPVQAWYDMTKKDVEAGKLKTPADGKTLKRVHEEQGLIELVDA